MEYRMCIVRKGVAIRWEDVRDKLTDSEIRSLKVPTSKTFGSGEGFIEHLLYDYDVLTIDLDESEEFKEWLIEFLSEVIE